MENQSMKIVLTSTKKGKKDTFGIEMNGEIFLENDINDISLPHHFCGYNWIWKTVEKVHNDGVELELVSKELNHLAGILHVYARSLIFMK